MAVCPQCRSNVNAFSLVSHDMDCPYCGTSLRFYHREYRRAARPGLYIAFAIIFNLFLTQDPIHRAVVSFFLLVAWLLFFKQYRDYLRTAVLEVKEEADD